MFGKKNRGTYAKQLSSKIGLCFMLPRCDLSALNGNISVLRWKQVLKCSITGYSLLVTNHFLVSLFRSLTSQQSSPWIWPKRRTWRNTVISHRWMKAASRASTCGSLPPTHQIPDITHTLMVFNGKHKTGFVFIDFFFNKSGTFSIYIYWNIIYKIPRGEDKT